MPTPCSRCKRANERCLVDVRSGRCKRCNDNHWKCNLRVTFQEFERLAKQREKRAKEAEDAEEELDDAEREAAAMIEAAHEKVRKARAKARRLRKELRFAESNEDESYARELAGVEEVERLEGASSVLPSGPSVEEMLAAGDLLDFPLDEGLDVNVLEASPMAWGLMTGSTFSEAIS